MQILTQWQERNGLQNKLEYKYLESPERGFYILQMFCRLGYNIPTMAPEKKFIIDDFSKSDIYGQLDIILKIFDNKLKDKYTGLLNNVVIDEINKFNTGEPIHNIDSYYLTLKDNKYIYLHEKSNDINSFSHKIDTPIRGITALGMKFIHDGGYTSNAEKDVRQKKSQSLKDWMLIFASMLAGIGTVGVVLIEILKKADWMANVDLNRYFFVFFSGVLLGIGLYILISEKITKQ